jgi:predicted XRE-type DNA-binding protein
VEGWNLTQAEAAKRLGVTQPRLNDFLRGRIDKFSLDALTILASQAGLSVKVKVTKRAA